METERQARRREDAMSTKYIRAELKGDNRGNEEEIKKMAEKLPELIKRIIRFMKHNKSCK